MSHDEWLSKWGINVDGGQAKLQYHHPDGTLHTDVFLVEKKLRERDGKLCLLTQVQPELPIRLFLDDIVQVVEIREPYTL